MSVNYKITPEAIPSTGILFVDNQKNSRSGHLGHALAEYKKDNIISFYSNCSGNRNKWSPGHNGFGWVEYKRSADGGKTWGEPRVLEYSWNSFLNETFTISCEKAVSPKEDTIVAFCLRNTNPNGWEPYLEPTVVRSEDGGETWSEATLFCDKCGRIYDAMVQDGVIYVLMHASADWPATKPEHKYYIYESSDCGKTFTLRSELPGDPTNHAYGNMVVREDSSLICYEYDKGDEYNMIYHLSYDMGATWAETGKSHCPKRIRNPQVARVNGGYILHGRAGCETPELPPDFVLYTSENGIDWDEGKYICAIPTQSGYYTNNLVMDQPDGSQRVLIQSSVPYDRGRVNVCHWFLDIAK